MDVAYQSFSTKQELYTYLQSQLQCIMAETCDTTAILANAAALLMLQLDHVNWAGFYLFKNGRLVLGPFQGKPAVAEIEMGKGVCGTAAATLQTQRVEDVHQCCNHIACDVVTNAEIVVPLLRADGSLLGVLDIDSPRLARFDAEDAAGLEMIAKILSAAWKE